MTTDEIVAMIAEQSKQQTEILKALKDMQTKEAGEQMHEKTPAAQGTFTPLHGGGGIFQGPGLERDVVSAHVRPYGLASKLPLIGTNVENPRFPALTGFTDVTGAEPTLACADAPSGYIKAANLTARFGMIRRDTQTIQMNQVFRQINRGDFTDLILRGKVLGLTDLTPSGLNEGQILDVVTMSEMVGAAVQLERVLTKQIWQGSYLVANQFPGLDVQVATGQKDADTGVAVPSLDSDVKDYAKAPISSTIVEFVGAMEWYIRNLAMQTGLDPVSHVIVMRPELWFELTALWPCAYNSNKCSSAVASNTTVFIDGRENVTERDAMRNGLYLDVNGNRYPVILDTGIFEKNNINTAGIPAGSYASSIYFLPLTISGGMPVLYREYLDYRMAQPDVNLMRGMEQFFWTDNGVYTWALEQVKWCYKWALMTEQRVILRTPHLAGRIDNVRYTPTQHLRDSDPSSPYWKDGGVSLRSALARPTAIWS